VATGTVIFHSAHPLVALRHKDGPRRAVSWGGMSFEPDERGVVMVPVEAVRELTESHGMEGVPEQYGHIEQAELPPPKEPDPAKPPRGRGKLAGLAPSFEVSETGQTTEGGAVRPTVFRAEGDHPEGGPQPALGPPPREAEVNASQSANPFGSH